MVCGLHHLLYPWQLQLLNCLPPYQLQPILHTIQICCLFIMFRRYCSHDLHLITLIKIKNIKVSFMSKSQLRTNITSPVMVKYMNQKIPTILISFGSKFWTVGKPVRWEPVRTENQNNLIINNCCLSSVHASWTCMQLQSTISTATNFIPDYAVSVFTST